MKDILTYPILPIKGITIFPGMMLHFDVAQSYGIDALKEGMENDQMVVVAFIKGDDETVIDQDTLEYIGILSKIRQMVKLPKGNYRVLLEGISRLELIQIDWNRNFYTGSYVELPRMPFQDTLENEALIRIAHESVKDYTTHFPDFPKETIDRMINQNDGNKLGDLIGYSIPLPEAIRVIISQTVHPLERLKLAIHYLNRENELATVKRDLQMEVKKKIDQNQKEYYLREQMKVIRTELGDKNGIDEEVEDLRQKLSAINAPVYVVEKIQKEINRLEKTNYSSQESVVIRNYLETLFEIPWGVKTEETISVPKAEKILNSDHYGLEKVKERILEYLAVRQLTNKTDSTILCLVGPPGTGKTSIASSIAEALNRKYVRISLGGVKDESEIRGHRKTYVGSMPGRIINGLIHAESMNPLMLLDEIDKMSDDFRGDPKAALLEVLDSEQNAKFRDHYLEITVDLSDVLFLATANSVQSIPKPLLDRMELIDITGYTENEKVHIAKKYLIPKQLQKKGLNKSDVLITGKAISKLIVEYTREAGVRQLERRVGEMLRKVAKQQLEENKTKIKIGDSNLESYLGKPVYRFEKAFEKPQIGIARGLAWTSVGGDTLSIEVNTMTGKGQFELTGQIGDVMKESARAAISYIRSVAGEFDIPVDFYEKTDIHIHIPEGAVPKDGPSAGITMATAMVSALTQLPVKNDVAMTGEITLRGRVLPIGGLKEKILAAKRAGIKLVLVPKQNERDIEELSEEVKENIQIKLVGDMNEVLAVALNKN